MPVLREVVLGGKPGAWAAAGFAVDEGGRVGLDGVTLRLAGGAGGLRSCGVAEVASAELDGLAFGDSGPPAARASHPNGACGVDHVVAVTPDPGRTRAALAGAGLAPRRLRDADDGTQQAFYVLHTALLELAGPVGEPGPARFWGLTIVVEDLAAAAGEMGEALGEVRQAVQPGRRIATVRESAGLGLPVALMTPR